MPKDDQTRRWRDVLRRRLESAGVAPERTAWLAKLNRAELRDADRVLRVVWGAGRDFAFARVDVEDDLRDQLIDSMRATIESMEDERTIRHDGKE